MDVEFFWILSRHFLSLPKFHPQEDLISGDVEVKQCCRHPLSVGCTYPNRWRIGFIISEKFHSSCVKPTVVHAKCWLDKNKIEKAIWSNSLKMQSPCERINESASIRSCLTQLFRHLHELFEVVLCQMNIFQIVSHVKLRKTCSHKGLVWVETEKNSFS